MKGRRAREKVERQAFYFLPKRRALPLAARVSSCSKLLRLELSSTALSEPFLAAARSSPLKMLAAPPRP
jgi:hypothetical protein